MLLRLVFAVNLFSFVLPAQDTRPRVLVLTDISNEPDDEESLVRFLVNANEFEIEGLVATTSVWLRDKVRPDIITATVNAYGQVRNNLALHSPGYPKAEDLLSRIRAGQTRFGMASGGDGKSTEGSKLILEAAARPDPRPLWIPVWGGANTLAQALWDARKTESPEALARLVSKLRVYTISDQDDSGKWLRDTFPNLYFIVSPSTVNNADYPSSTWSGIAGDRFYRNSPMVDFELVDTPWLTANIIEGHGPLGARYPKPVYIMEGDTPSFLNLIGNGLASERDPSWGGWGGRYTLRQSYGESRPIYTNARDTVTLPSGQLYSSNQATIWRWRRAYQNDFAVRMDWCVQPRDKANHHPIPMLNKTGGKAPVLLSVRSGNLVELAAEGTSDPDKDFLSYRWWVYPEAGDQNGEIILDTPGAPATRFYAPEVKKKSTIHVILEVVDRGTPALTAYRRAVITIEP